MIIIDGKVLAQNVTPEEIGMQLFKTIKLVSFLGTNALEPIIATHLNAYLEDGLDMKECSHALASIILTEAANVIISLKYSQGLMEKGQDLTEKDVSDLKVEGLADARDFLRTFTLALDPATLAAVYGIPVDKTDPDMNPIIN